MDFINWIHASNTPPNILNGIDNNHKIGNSTMAIIANGQLIANKINHKITVRRNFIFSITFFFSNRFSVRPN